MNGASAYTDATVGTSFMEINVDDVMPLHGPIAAIIASAGFVVPALSPGLPPVATRYNRGSLPYTAVLLQFHKPEMLKSPLAPVSTVWEISAVATDLSPVL